MPRLNKLSLWAPILVVELMIIALTLSTPALQPEISYSIAARTYLFWAIVVIPVAVLTDMVARTALSYPAVKRVKARYQR